MAAKQIKRTGLVKAVCDEDGRIVLFQSPNAPILGWVVFTVLAKIVTQSNWQNLFSALSFGFLFTWCWLEIISGQSPFRRFLGAVVLSVSLYNRFV